MHARSHTVYTHACANFHIWKVLISYANLLRVTDVIWVNPEIRYRLCIDPFPSVLIESKG